MTAFGNVCLRAALAAATLFAAALGTAQAEYPTQTIKIIVPVPPGLLLDVLPRIIGEKLAARWKTTVVIENRPGAGGNIGAEAVAKAEPDGHTLFATAPGPLVTNQYLYAKLGFDPAAFVPITEMASFPFVLTVNPKLPVSNLAGLIAYAKANPGKVTFGTPGIGSTPHLAMEKLMNTTGARFVLVPYPGLPPAQRDLVAGHIDAMFDAPGNAYPLIKDGRVKPLAVTSKTRMSAFPDVSTISETVPGFVHIDWLALVAPPNTPPQIAATLSKAIAETLKLPDVAERIAMFQVTPVGSSSSELAELLKRESEEWRKVIAVTGIKM